MRRPITFTLLAAFALTASAADMPRDMPKRKTGLWEMKTSIVEMGGITQTFEMCVGADTDNLLYQKGQTDKNCERQDWKRSGNGVDFSAVCRVEGSTATLNGRFQGDFDSAYSGELLTSYSPPLQGIASATMKQEARWTGPCKAGQKPGDVVMKGVSGINVEQLMKNMQRR